MGGGPPKVVLSWSARELGQGLACLAAFFFVRDPRVILIVLFSSWVREVLDFIDFFRIAGTPARLYGVVGTSVIMHTLALLSVFKVIKQGSGESSRTKTSYA